MAQDYVVTQWEVPSFTSRDTYIVNLYHSGDYTCSCPAYHFHSDVHCKHILAVRRNPNGYDRYDVRMPPVMQDPEENVLNLLRLAMIGREAIVYIKNGKITRIDITS